MNGQEIIILIQGEPIQKRGAQVEIVDGLFKTFAHLHFVNKYSSFFPPDMPFQHMHSACDTPAALTFRCATLR